MRDTSDYGLLGDTRTAALTASDGSIDWMCVPRFDSDPLFARLLAGEDGGCFRLGPAASGPPVERRYRARSTVLETTWPTSSGRVVLTEGMVADIGGRLLPTLCLVRRVEAVGSPATVELRFDPRFGFDRMPPRRRGRPGYLVCSHGALALSLATSPPLEVRPGSEAVRVQVEPGRPLTAVLTAADRAPLTRVDPDEAWRALLDDESGWERWCAGIEYEGPFGEAVERSLVTLRLLTYSPSGAPVAAPTTSLPERVGGERNWDYRYAWPRDAALGIGAFLGVGLAKEARTFLYWLLHAGRLDRPRLPPVLTVHGRPVPAEREIPEWPGFADSTPVRFGNGARDQHQLDVYGWVLDAMWLLVDAGHPLYGETWRMGRGLADFVAGHWREPDSGIWEVRGDPAHYVHSKLMAWLALDRALRIAERQGASERRRKRWSEERDAVADDVRHHGFDEKRSTFVRAYGSTDLDAATLVLPLLDLEPAASPRVVGTVQAVRRELSAGGPWVYRYPQGADGRQGEEGAFLPCSFWLVQALAKTGAIDDAMELMAQLGEAAGPLALFAEEVDPASGAPLGNFPQALTHASLVQAALAIRDATRAATGGPGRSRTPGAPAP